MDLVSTLHSLGSWPGYILPFIFVLTLVVFFHELGHFMVARWCGVAVKTFSIGFGPELLGFTDRKGTRWRLSLIPLGGYVKFLGDDNEAGHPDREELKALSPEERAKTFAGKSVAKRAAIVAAGPVANFLLAIVIFTALALLYGRQIITPRIDAVTPGSPAAAAGLMAGDVVKSIDGRQIDSYQQIDLLVATSTGQSLEFVVDRGGESKAIAVRAERGSITDRFGQKQVLGTIGISGPKIPARVAWIEPGSPAEAAGFQVGDRIETIDAAPVDRFEALQKIVRVAAGKPLSFGILRGDRHIVVEATPKGTPDQAGGTVGKLGIGADNDPADIHHVAYGVVGALQSGVEGTWLVVDRTAAYLAGVVSGRESADQLGGPIRVAQIAQQAASISIETLISLVATLSISIGLINLFPVPMLDGGHLLFFLAEAIRGKPLSDRIQDIGFRIGFAAVVALMIFAFSNDIIHLNWF